MGRFFSQDGAFFRIGTTAADVAALGLLWLAASLPLVTMGAATTAVFYVATKRAGGRDAYVWRDFWKSFRQNFALSTTVFLTLAAIFALLAFNIQNMGFMEVLADIALVVQFFILIEAVFVALYAFPIIARFEMGYVQVLKTALFMANRHFLTTICLAALLAAVFFTSVVATPLLIPVAMGIYSFPAAHLIVRVFKKHRADFDAVKTDEPLEPLNFDD